MSNHTTFNKQLKSAKAKFYRSDFEGALANYTTAINLNPADKAGLAEAYNGRGFAKNVLERREEGIEDYDKAIRLCNEVIDLEPENAIAWNNRGFAKGALGHWGDAITDFDEAIRLDPKDAGALNNRGLVKNELGLYEGAIKDYDKVIDLAPKDKNLLAIAWDNSGIAKYNLDRHEDALADHDEAIRYNPYYAIAWYNRGFAKDNLGRHKEAIADYTEAIHLNPKRAAAWNNRGWVKSQIGDFDGAVKDFAEALRLSPNEPRFLNNLTATETRKKIRDSVGEEVDEIKKAEEFKKQAEEYEHREKVNRRWAYVAMAGLAIIIIFLVFRLIVPNLPPEYFSKLLPEYSFKLPLRCSPELKPECLTELKPVDIKNLFNLLPLIALIIIITSPLVWTIRLLIAAANKAELMRAEYRHLALVERRMFVYFAKDDTDEGKQIRADYIKATMTNSPADKLVALQNKAGAPSPSPVQNIIETIRSKARSNSPS